MSEFENAFPTMGVLAGWHAYAGTLHTYLGPVYRGVRAAARNLNCNLLLSCGIGLPMEAGQYRPAWPVPGNEVDFVPVGPWNTDGLIAIGPLLSEERTQYIQQLDSDGFPVVFIGFRPSGWVVSADNEGGIRQALSHLAMHGHQRIAFISWERYQEGIFRREAYEKVISELGLISDPALIIEGQNSEPGGQQAIRQLLQSGTEFTAVLANNDEAALGAISALREFGLMVPQDVAVVGIDDRTEAEAHIPPLTTVRYPTFELGYRAVEILIERLAVNKKDPKVVQVPMGLVVRESCGCLPGRHHELEVQQTTNEALLEMLDDKAERPKDKAWIVGKIIIAMRTKIQRMTPEEIHRSSQQLIDALIASLEQGDNLLFRLVLQQILHRTTQLGENPNAWQSAISIFRDQASLIQAISSPPPTRLQVDDAFDQARLAISEIVQSQQVRLLVDQAEMAERVEQMTSQFLTAQNEDDVFELLKQDLPEIGIRHAFVAFYEAGEDDPVAWSVLQPAKNQLHFPTRHFPPKGVYAQDEPFALALLPLQIQEDLRGFVAFDAGNLRPCGSITRQLAAALRGVRLYRQAIEGRRLAEEANRLKSRFLSTVSHELRTPLNLITGLSEIVLNQGVTSKPDKLEVDRKKIERINLSAQHLDGLIRDVLDLARSEAGQLKLICEPLDLAEVFQPVIAIGEQLARDKGISWRDKIPNRLPRVWGDRTRLRQVLLNLISNAVKFTSAGEVALVITLELDRVFLDIHDTGLGIPINEQGSIFDEFQQSERTTARGYGGLGLGLAICKQLVELHGGEIGVRSSGQEGDGSTFWVTLPLMDQWPGFTDRLVSLVESSQILLLVKDPGKSEFLSEHLSQQGFDLAIFLLETQRDWLSQILVSPPQAVLLDLDLTSELGWEIIRVLKENPRTQQIPVMFYNLAADQSALLEIDYLIKPLQASKIGEILARQGILQAQNGSPVQKVLVVDDDPGILEMHAQIIETYLHCCVLRARNGLEALEVIREERPDLVLLDLMMPELDGFGVLEVMRTEHLDRDLSVVVLTSQVLTEEDMSRLNQGVASVLSKGVFSASETLAHLQAALERRKILPAETQQIVRKAMAYIHEHFAEAIALEEVASIVGLSERHLTRSFRRETDMTVIQYLNRYRIKQARILLEKGDLPITQVAIEVGFSDSHYFARVFRREVGVSPSLYQQGKHT